MTIQKPYWVFGYGSLIWKPPPHAVEKRGSGYVKNVVRRFAQSSNDHRGTPDRPGRVVTVMAADDWHRLAGTEPGHLHDRDDVVWGVAYRIDPAKAAEVRAYMEHREKNGYTSHDFPVYTTGAGGEEVAVPEATIWIGTLDNEAFVGYEPLAVAADLIHKRVGPSGPNKEYLYELAEAVRHLYPHVKDKYLFELDAAVRALDAADPTSNGA